MDLPSCAIEEREDWIAVLVKAPPKPSVLDVNPQYACLQWLDWTSHVLLTASRAAR
jgi:hypothetical protein